MSDEKDANWVQRMESDFQPEQFSGIAVPAYPDARMAHASEYAAYQLGQINRRLGRLIELIENAGNAQAAKTAAQAPRREQE